MRVIITGGTGQIGTDLSKSLVADGHEVIVLTRSPQQKTDLPESVQLVHWDTKTGNGWAELAEGAAIVNLAGANLAGDGFLPTRWSDERKKLLRDSRVHAGQAVVDAVQQTTKKPQVVIQSSAVGYYGPHPMDKHLTEAAPAGDDYLAKLCVDWEESTAAVEEMGVRRAIIRSGVVLSFEDGALYRLALPFKLFAGGPLGSGKQPFPWIHPVDEVNAIRFLIDNQEASGAFNLTAPEPVSNGQFAKALGNVMGRPSYMPVPGFAFRMAFGEVSDVILTGQAVVPERLQAMGFTFQFPDAEAALRDLYTQPQPA